MNLKEIETAQATMLRQFRGACEGIGEHRQDVSGCTVLVDGYAVTIHHCFFFTGTRITVSRSSSKETTVVFMHTKQVVKFCPPQEFLPPRVKSVYATAIRTVSDFSKAIRKAAQADHQAA